MYTHSHIHRHVCVLQYIQGEGRSPRALQQWQLGSSCFPEQEFWLFGTNLPAPPSKKPNTQQTLNVINNEDMNQRNNQNTVKPQFD